MKSGNRYAKAYEASRNGAKAKFSNSSPVRPWIEMINTRCRMLERAFIESDEQEAKSSAEKIVERAQYLQRMTDNLIESAKRSGQWSRKGAKSTHAAQSGMYTVNGDSYTVDVERDTVKLRKSGDTQYRTSISVSEFEEMLRNGNAKRSNSRTGAKSTHAADSLRALAVKLGYAPDAVTVEDGRGTIRFARNDGSAGRLAFSLRKPLAGVIASDRISVADDAVCIDMRGES